MAVTMYCPSLRCPTVVQAHDAHRGKIVECAQCGVWFRVPDNPRSRVADEEPLVIETLVVTYPFDRPHVPDAGMIPMYAAEAEALGYRSVAHFALCKSRNPFR